MDSLTSPSVKSGNVLALLNTLYTSGFAMASPSAPMLKGRTMHTLYALSFLIYVVNCLCDWIHVYYTLKGHVTSFPLHAWLVVTMASIAVAGTMLAWLLLVLCVENAFAHRLDITPYRSGFALIAEAFVEWLQAFNNFRVAFLVMLLHDGPMTFINFYFIASCRCVGPEIASWPLLLSSFSSVVSLLWRINMLYFGYRRLLFHRSQTKTAGVQQFPTLSEHYRSATDTSSGGRMSEYDECWPIRWAKLRVYGADIRLPNEESESSGTRSGSFLPSYTYSCHVPILGSILEVCVKIVLFIRVVCLSIGCIVLSTLAYLAFCLSCWIPCCFHYCCRTHSFYHRHKCSRSFVRYCSYGFHYSTMTFSFCLTIVLVVMNVILLSSVHTIGSNTVPPEIDRICVTVVPAQRLIHAQIIPKPFIAGKGLEQYVLSEFLPRDPKATTACKPLLSDGGLGFGLKRKAAGPWQTRIFLDDRIVSVATQVSFNTSDPFDSHLLLRYDYAILEEVLRFGRPTYRCRRGAHTGWKFEFSHRPLPWPYFVGCKKNWRNETARIIECDDRDLEVATTTKTSDGWRRRTHRTRHPWRTSTVETWIP